MTNLYYILSTAPPAPNKACKADTDCQNSGTCTLPAGTCDCSSTAGFTGSNCEKGTVDNFNYSL